MLIPAARSDAMNADYYAAYRRWDATQAAHAEACEAMNVLARLYRRSVEELTQAESAMNKACVELVAFPQHQGHITVTVQHQGTSTVTAHRELR
jgi:hypothetical protein